MAALSVIVLVVPAWAVPLSVVTEDSLGTAVPGVFSKDLDTVGKQGGGHGFSFAGIQGLAFPGKLYR